MKLLRYVGLVEGLSFLVLLLIAMPMKYLWGQPEAVRLVGSLHGGLFLAYVALATYVSDKGGWPTRKLLTAYAAAILPLGPFLLDKKLYG